MIEKFVSHGDVNLHPLKKEVYEKLLKGSQEEIHQGNFVLQHGETTGHKHVLVAEPDVMEIHTLSDGRGRILRIKKDAYVTHEDHGVLPVKEGYYIQTQERELDHFSESIERKVID